MIKNYLVVALRSIVNNKSASIINISGLSIGFACFILVSIYVYQEYSYDRYHKNSENLFRLTTIDEALGVSSNNVAITLPTMAPAAKENFPEVINAARILNQGRIRMEQGENYVYAENAKYIEADFFEMFDYELDNPSALEAFREPRKLLLTESMATTTFGDMQPVGQVLQINDQDWEVVGLMKDIKSNNHLEFDVLMSLYPSAADSSLAQYLDSWQGLGMIGYLQLQDATMESTVEQKMRDLALENEVVDFWIPQLQRLTDIHLGSSDILFDSYNTNKGDITYVYSLGGIALFVILIAAFNFMNLSTAKSSGRAKEVGVRKVLGARQASLMKQHLGESIVISFVSLFLASVLVVVVGPFVDLGLSFPITYYLEQPVIIGFVLSTALIIGILAGLYPAFILSNFKSIQILRGRFQTGKSGVLLRKLLVVAQFATSIVMIIGTILVFRQLDYIKNKDLGFNKEQVVTLRLVDQSMGDRLAGFKDKLVEFEGIEYAGVSSNMPGRTFGRTGITPEGMNEEDENWIVSAISFDQGYLETMGMELVEGRNYSEEYSTDQQDGIIVNESLIRQVGWETGLNKKIIMGNNAERTIIGVVKDFHYANMRHVIEPLIMFYNPGPGGNISFRMNQANVKSSMEYAEQIWSEIYPEYPFDYQFFDEEFNQIYQSDDNFSRLVVSFTWLAIFIACLGLFGLSAYMAEQRRKEIGVRKVLGSSVNQIVVILSKEFVVLILLATLIAWPMAYFGIEGWLTSYQYRIDLLSTSNLLIFGVSGLLAMIIGLGTVGYQGISAAMSNPVNSLRDE